MRTTIKTQWTKHQHVVRGQTTMSSLRALTKLTSSAGSARHTPPTTILQNRGLSAVPAARIVSPQGHDVHGTEETSLALARVTSCAPSRWPSTNGNSPTHLERQSINGDRMTQTRIRTTHQDVEIQPPRLLTVSYLIWLYLRTVGCSSVFGIPSGTMSRLWKDLDEFQPVRQENPAYQIRLTLTANEAGAGYMAAWANRAAGMNGARSVPVVLVEGSVGAPNAINGMIDALSTKQPLLLLTGRPSERHSGLHSMQGFSVETLLSSVMKNGRSMRATDRDTVFELLNSAFYTAASSPAGPVHLAIPLCLQKELVTPHEVDVVLEMARQTVRRLEADARSARSAVRETSIPQLQAALDTLCQAPNGIVLLGSGCLHLDPQARVSLMRLLERLGWPVATTIGGKGSIDEENTPHYIGTMGVAASKACLTAFRLRNRESALLVLGSNMGEMTTSVFSPDVFQRHIIQVDLDDTAFRTASRLVSERKNTTRFHHRRVQADLSEAVKWMEAHFDDKLAQHRRPSDAIARCQADLPLFHTARVLPPADGRLSLAYFFSQLGSIIPDNEVIACDMGGFTLFAARHLCVTRGCTFLTDFNRACMGSALAGAVGLARHNPNRRVTIIAGDGCFLMNGMEMLTAARYNLPVTFVVINNRGLAIVRQGHRAQYQGAECLDVHQGGAHFSVAAWAEAAGIRSMQLRTVNDMNQLSELIRPRGFNDPHRTSLVEVCVEMDEIVPMETRYQTHEDGVLEEEEKEAAAAQAETQDQDKKQPITQGN